VDPIKNNSVAYKLVRRDYKLAKNEFPCEDVDTYMNVFFLLSTVML